MQFNHTISQVLDKSKVQTSRLWHDNWELGYNGAKNVPSAYDALYSFSIIETQEGKTLTYRKVYTVGQTLAVQAGRGKKGVARIRITGLEKRDVRSFTDEDIQREGFTDRLSFFRVWYGMHFPAYVKLLDEGSVTPEWWLDATKAQIAAHNTALVIRFELVHDPSMMDIPF